MKDGTVTITQKGLSVILSLFLLLLLLLLALKDPQSFFQLHLSNTHEILDAEAWQALIFKHNGNLDLAYGKIFPKMK